MTMMPDPNQQDLSGNYYPQESDLTGGLPINLDSLRDGPPGSKPFYPYSTLIRYVNYFIYCLPFIEKNAYHLFSYAIKGSPNQKLLLEDIYYAIESRACIIKQKQSFCFLTFLFSFHTSERLPMAGK